jgi:type IV pilus assembly protein PilE
LNARDATRTPARSAAAFSLMELVVALAIVAALAAYALPSYREHVARAHRADAAMALYRAAQFLEAGSDAHASGAVVLPAGLDQAPPVGAPVYRLQVVDGDRASGYYALEARPVDAGPMAGDACGTFILDVLGERMNRRAGSRGTMDPGCWLARR